MIRRMKAKKVLTTAFIRHGKIVNSNSYEQFLFLPTFSIHKSEPYINARSPSSSICHTCRRT